MKGETLVRIQSGPPKYSGPAHGPEYKPPENTRTEIKIRAGSATAGRLTVCRLHTELDTVVGDYPQVVAQRLPISLPRRIRETGRGAKTSELHASTRWPFAVRLNHGTALLGLFPNIAC